MSKELIERYNHLHYNQDSPVEDDGFVDFLIDNTRIDAPEVDLDKAWALTSHKIKSKDQNSYGWMKVAASIAVVLSVAFAAWQINSSPDQNYISTTDQKLEVTFPDGSKGILNNNSSFSFPDRFEETRNVSFEGEAYFDIKKSNKPFVIDAGGVTVKVLGTAFNLNSTKNSVELFVERGLVAFVKDGEEIKVSAGKEAIFDKNELSVAFSSIPDSNAMSWKNGIFKFDKTPLSEALDQLEDYYNVSFKLTNKEIANCQITATFDNQPLKDVIKSLETLLTLKTSKLGNTVKISGEGC